MSMGRRFLTSFALVCALAPLVPAQGDAAAWVKLAPEGEEFVVSMPARPVRVARMLPDSEHGEMMPNSYEAVGGEVRYSVLSFYKQREGGPKTFDALVGGLRDALLGAQNGDFVLEHERDLTLDGRHGKQFSLRTGKPLGTVRVYDGASHYYALIAFGGRAGEPDPDRFFSSFTLAPERRAAAGIVKLQDANESETPASFWPAVPVATSVGVVIGDRPGGPAAGSKRAPVSGGVLKGKIISTVPPVYPAIARAARASGTIVVEIVFDEGGKVISARAVSGHPLLQQAAVEAVRQWRFQPVSVGGQPVKVSGTVTVNFVLQ
jgi:TonB family protein